MKINYRYLLAATLACPVLLGGCGSGGSPATPAQPPVGNPTPSQTPTPTPTPPQTPIPATLNVAFIGGSITEGAGATSYSKSYAGLLTQWLNERFSQVNVLNAGIGGTDSRYAVYRLVKDLETNAGQFVPDLAFIEFTQNDPGDRRFIFTYVDAMIWKLRQLNPRIRIVVVATSAPGEEVVRRAGSRDERSFFMEDIASMDDVQFVEAASALWGDVISNGTAASSYFDGVVHPNDKGHASYASVIEQAIAPTLLTVVAPTTRATYITQSRLQDATRLPLKPSLIGSSCAALTENTARFDGGLDCSLGQTFSFSFSGTALGFVRRTMPDGGQLACSFDGGPEQLMNFWQKDSINSTDERPAFFGLQSNGTHVVQCRVTDVKPSDGSLSSTGNHVVVGNILVSSEQLVSNL